MIFIYHFFRKDAERKIFWLNLVMKIDDGIANKKYGETKFHNKMFKVRKLTQCIEQWKSYKKKMVKRNNFRWIIFTNSNKYFKVNYNQMQSKHGNNHKFTFIIMNLSQFGEIPIKRDSVWKLFTSFLWVCTPLVIENEF